MSSKYPVKLTIDYPDKELDRVSTFLRIFYAIPILIVVGLVSAGTYSMEGTQSTVATAGGVLFLPVLLMIVVRQKYPRWWFNWNLELLRFSTRVNVYLSLLDDMYPSTDEQQSVHLDITYPNVQKNLNRWAPLYKWFLAIPHYVVLLILNFAAFFATVFAWVAILITGRYPRSIFEFVVGVMRWNLRVAGYAFILATDVYPPFSMNE